MASAKDPEIVEGEVVDIYDKARAVTDVAQRLKDDILRNVSSFDDAVALADEIYGDVVDIADYAGSGFSVLSDKSKLVGVPFIIVDWRINDGDYGAYASMTVVTKNNEKLIVNDGSTGIALQLKDLTEEHGFTGGVKVMHGLRASEYDTCPECGVPMTKSEPDCPNTRCDYEGERRAKGATYYLDTSK